MKRSELKELQAQYLTLDRAEKLLEVYRVEGWKDMFAKTPTSNEKKELTEKDVFNDVNKKG